MSWDHPNVKRVEELFGINQGMIMSDAFGKIADRTEKLQKTNHDILLQNIDLQIERNNLRSQITPIQDKHDRLLEKLKLLRRYHGGDGSITREQVIEVLGDV
jgi:hypothetical protein